MIAINVESKLAPTWFESQQDKSDEVGWLLKPLSGMEFMQIQAGASINADGNFTYTGQAIRDTLRFGIKDFKGFSDEKGEPLVFNFYILDLLPSNFLNEVFSEIINRAFIREYERKNSSLQ